MRPFPIKILATLLILGASIGPTSADEGHVAATAPAAPDTPVRWQLDDQSQPASVDSSTEAAETDHHDDAVLPASLNLLQPPLQPTPPVIPSFGVQRPAAAEQLAQEIFASPEVRRSLIQQSRGAPPPLVGSELIFGSEGNFRVSTDGGNLLGKSLHSPGIRVQQRTPIVTDPRVRSQRIGRLLASGSYWFPARQDLDTALSKIDSRLIENLIVIKGPYGVVYGPGFDFIDFQFAATPRYAGGAEYHASSSLEFKTNGEQWYGRQAVWGGGDDYGIRISYGHRTGGDYYTGQAADGSFFEPERLGTSYNSRHLDVALGYDLTDDSRLEFNYLRLDQTNVEFPGLVFDINALVTDGFELRYVLEDQALFDRFTAEGWYNRTSFGGDTRRRSKNRQIPGIRDDLELGPDQFLVTDVDGMSAGYRLAWSWGDSDCGRLTLGTDLIRVGQQLNDWEPERDVPTGFPPPLPPTFSQPAQNFPIPRSSSLDFGLFAEYLQPVSERLTVGLGTRLDMVSTTARNRVPGLGIVETVGFPPELELVEVSMSELKMAELDQQFTPWSVFLTADYRLDCCWNLTAGAGIANRPPTLTELYTAGSFIGTLQPGFTSLEGDPELEAERLYQVDLGVHGDLGPARASLTGFFAWINDYITYDDLAVYSPLDPVFEPGQEVQKVYFTNTDLATLAGFEFLGEVDLTCWLAAFAVVSYVEGRDHSRSTPSRLAAAERERLLAPAGPRSLVENRDEEPLPGIPPLEARLGLRWHQPVTNPDWLLEFEARVVDNQDRIAASLYERPTPGFAVFNLRGYWRPWDDVTVISGVENLADRFYREHLDYRPGRGVYQPGVNFYVATEVVY